MTATEVSSMAPVAHPQTASSEPLQALVRSIRSIGRTCVVCARIPLSRQDVEYLLSLPDVASVILLAEDRNLAEAFPGRLGHYKSNGIDLTLPVRMAEEFLYIGSWTEFGTRAALEVWRAGVRGIWIASALESWHRYSLSLVVIRKMLDSAYRRVGGYSFFRAVRKNKSLNSRIEEFLYARKLRRIGLHSLAGNAPYHQERIVVVGASLGPGGGERQLAATLCGLVAHGHKDVHFLHHWPMVKPNDFYLPALTRAAISYSQVAQFGASNELSAELESALAYTLRPLGDLGMDIGIYAKELLIRRPEVVHIWQDQMNVIVGLAALLAGVPRIYLSCRSLSPTHFSFHQPYMRPIYRLLAQFPNVVFLNNSAAGARDYSRWLGIKAKRIKVIRNGFDTEGLLSPEKRMELRVAYRQGLGIPLDATVVGVVMRISEEKRPLLWVQIAQHVAARLPGVHFLVVGDGPMREVVESIAHSTLPGTAHFPGREHNSAMAIAAMDLFLLTSRIEGLPNVLIEAQAIGVPPISIDVGGAAEALIPEQTGWLVASEAPEVVADRIVSLLTDRQSLEEAARKGPAFVHERFNWERMIRETLAAYGYGDAA